MNIPKYRNHYLAIRSTATCFYNVKFVKVFSVINQIIVNNNLIKLVF